MADDDFDPRLGEVPEVGPRGARGFLIEPGTGAPPEFYATEDADYERLLEAQYDAEMDFAAEYEAGVIEQGIRDQAHERAATYLSEHGDAVWARVDRFLRDADALLPVHAGASLVCCITAAELVIRFLLLRPLLAGLIFNNALADEVARRASTGSTSRDREMLPMVCHAWDIDLAGRQLDGRRPLWPALCELWVIRDGFVHRGEAVSPSQAETALRSTRLLINELVVPLADRLRLAWPHGKWLTGMGHTAKDPVAAAR